MANAQVKTYPLLDFFHHISIILSEFLHTYSVTKNLALKYYIYFYNCFTFLNLC